MRNKKLSKNLPVFLTIVLLIFAINLNNANFKTANIVDAGFESSAKGKSGVLMELESETILVDNNGQEKLPIASVTKLMTILLTLEEIDAGNFNVKDKIMVSENASNMGGSQIFLDGNSEYEIGQLLKSVIVASANDSSVALAEHIAGSEQNFVKLMNEKSIELGLENTHYSNCTGLPSNDGYSCAMDQAIVLKQVLSFDLYHTYSSIWLEDFIHPSGRITQMANTNKLSRFYDGCMGGKTGSTNQAKYCLAVGAEKNDTKLIAVVLGAENSKERFRLASEMLDYGFENFESKTIFSSADLADKSIKIKGDNNEIELKAERDFSLVCEKNSTPNFSLNFNLPHELKKVKENEVVGSVEIVINGVVVDNINILSCSTFEEPTVFDYFKEIIIN